MWPIENTHEHTSNIVQCSNGFSNRRWFCNHHCKWRQSLHTYHDIIILTFIIKKSFSSPDCRTPTRRGRTIWIISTPHSRSRAARVHGITLNQVYTRYKYVYKTIVMGCVWTETRVETQGTTAVASILAPPVSGMSSLWP